MKKLLITINCNANSDQLKSAFDAALTALVFYPESTIVLIQNEDAVRIELLQQASGLLLDNFGVEPLEWFNPSGTRAQNNPLFSAKPCLSKHRFQSLLQNSQTVINL